MIFLCVREDSVRENIDELPQDFTLSTITFEENQAHSPSKQSLGGVVEGN